jgi:hypothetical protein
MGAPVEPGAEGIGLREWFRGLPRMSCVGAAFDTKADAPAAFTGRASIVLARRMRRSGLAMVDEPKSFLVAKSGGLKSGEADRAERWGQLVASQATSRLSAGLQRRAQ